VYLTSTPDSVLVVKTGAGVVTRVSLPEEAKSAVCGDLYDPATNAGSFIITRDGNDVYIKPVPKTNAKSNLFVKTDKDVFNFDLVIVPAEQAHRVVNVNIPRFEKDLEAYKTEARTQLEAEFQQKRMELEATVQAVKDQLARENDGKLEEERKRLRAEADQRVNDLLMTRFVDGMLLGFTRVAMIEKSGKLGPVSVAVDPEALTFEGRLYVKYRITNNSAEDVVYLEPGLTLMSVADGNVPIAAKVHTADGIFRVPAKETATGVIVFEQPVLQRGDKVVLNLRGEDAERMNLRLNILVGQ
jgi:hypothetical protein